MWNFTKKYFLRDSIVGIVDIHNHILPGIDDGAATIEVSKEMLSLYKELGFSGCIATPHVMADYYRNTTSGIQNSFKEITEVLKTGKHGGFIQHAAAEYMLDDQFLHLLEKEDLLFIKDRVLLTELSYFNKPSYLLELCYDIVARNIFPILAHPERYGYIKSIQDFKELKEYGFMLQLNMLSLSGHYGEHPQRMSEELLLAGMYDCIGTDAHRPDHLDKIKNLQIPYKLVDSLMDLCEGQHFL